jgi:hypothetical protein
MMLMVTLYAVLFAFMKLMGADPVFFVVVGLLVFGVGLGQVFLFGGKYPRAASIWTGACLLPVETIVAFIYTHLAEGGGSPSEEEFAAAFLIVLFFIPLGAAAGYLAGGLTAGVFLVLQWWGREPESDGAEETVEAEGQDSGAGAG